MDIIDTRTLGKVKLSLDITELDEGLMCSFVALDAKGAMWARFGTSLYRIVFDADGSVSRTSVFRHPGLRGMNHVFEDVDGDGSVWIKIDGQLNKISPVGESEFSVTPIAPSLDFGEDTYVSDFQLSYSTVWIATENGLYRLNKSTGEWKLYVNSPSDPGSLTQNFISSLAMTKDERLLVSTLYGLNVYNPLTDDFERVGTDIINCIRVKGDNLFVATENRGLRIATPKSLYVKNFSFSSGAVNAIWQEPGGRLWVGSVEGGLSVRKAEGEPVLRITRESGGLTHNSVSALRPGPEGIMFVGTWGGGVNVFSSDAKPHFLYSLPEYDGLTDYVGVLEYDKINKKLWIGSNRGIFLYDPKTRSYSSALDADATGCIGSCIDSFNQLWIGCLEGLYVFDLTKEGFPYTYYNYKLDNPESRIDEKISCVMEAAPGVMYVGSNGSGVYKGTRGDDGRYAFVSYSKLQGLSSDSVRGLCEDSEGRIWISTEYGLNLLDPESGVITSFLEKDGLSSAQFHWNNACQGTNN